MQNFRENKNLILMQFIPYIRNIKNKMFFEFRKTTKIRIFRLSQGLNNY